MYKNTFNRTYCFDCLFNLPQPAHKKRVKMLYDGWRWCISLFCYHFPLFLDHFRHCIKVAHKKALQYPIFIFKGSSGHCCSESVNSSTFPNKNSIRAYKGMTNHHLSFFRLSGIMCNATKKKTLELWKHEQHWQLHFGYILPILCLIPKMNIFAIYWINFRGLDKINFDQYCVFWGFSARSSKH